MNFLQLIEKSTKFFSQIPKLSRPSVEWADYITDQRTEMEKIDCSSVDTFLSDIHVNGNCEKELFAFSADISHTKTPQNRTLYIGGRQPHTYNELLIDGDGVGSYFAQLAYMKAQSVFAFIELASNLRHFQAPVTFIERCDIAAKNQLLHTKLMQELAEIEGFFIPPVRYSSTTNNIFSVAMHNAVEGCVYETWSALIANWQSTHLAADPELQTVYEQIGQDEARHSQLAWDVHAWFLKKLTKRQQKMLHKEQTKAVAELLLSEGRISTIEGLGLPLSHERKMLSSVFCAQLVA